MLTDRRRRRWAAGAALMLPIVTLASPFLFSSTSSLYGFDFWWIYVPHASVAKETLRREGELPRWNPYQYAGTPYLGSFQHNYYYPPNWIFLVSRSCWAVGFAVALHLLMASWGMYRLTRAFRLDRAGCAMAGIAYGLSFAVLPHIDAGHLTAVITFCQAPMLIALIVKTVKRADLLHAAVLGAWIGGIFLSGHPQWIYHLALLAAAVTIWRIIELAREGGSWRRAVGAIAAAVLLGFCLAAVQLLPSLEVGREQSREAILYPDKVVPARQSMTAADGFFLLIPRCPWDTGSEDLIKPRHGWWERGTYIGITPLFLALLALIGPRTRAALFFAIAGAVMLLDSFATDLPVHSLLSLLPRYGDFRIPARSAWIAVLCFCALAAFGWDGVFRGAWTLRRLHFSVAAVAALFGAALLIFVFHYHILRESGLFLGLVLISASLAAFAPGRARLGIAAVAVVALDVGFYGRSNFKTMPSAAYEDPPWYAAHIGPERGDYRLLEIKTFSPAQPISHGFHLLNGAGYPLPRSTPAFYAKAWSDYPGPTPDALLFGLSPGDPAVLDALSVRWIVTAAPAIFPHWRKLADQSSMHLYENPTARPMISLSGDGDIAVHHRSMNGFDAVCRCPREQELIVSQAWMPGWRAEIDGVAAPVEPAYGALLRLRVPAGESRVRLVYTPASWQAGRIFLILGILAELILLSIEVARRRRLSPSCS